MTTIPTLQEIKNTLIANFQSEFNIVIPTTGKSFLRALCGVVAAAIWLCYKYLGNIQKNIFVDTCDIDTLLRFGTVRLGRLPFPATQGYYTATVTGSTSGVIPAGTVFKSDDNSLSPGLNYILDTAYTMPAPTGTITLRALTPGLEARLNVGDTLTATAPIANVNSGAMVATEVTIPESAETEEEYRAKVLISFRLEPQGGAGADYRIWGLDAQGTKQIYPYTPSGAANEVTVYVEATVADSTDGHGTPTSQILLDVAADIEEDPDVTLPAAERKRRPIGVFQVNVLPIVALPVDINIPGGVGGNLATQAIIDTALGELIDSIRPFIASCDVLSERNDVISVNNVVAAIYAAVPGIVINTPTVRVNTVLISSYTWDNGRIPYKNTVTFV